MIEIDSSFPKNLSSQLYNSTFEERGFIAIRKFFDWIQLDKIREKCEPLLNENHCLPMPFRVVDEVRDLALTEDLGALLFTLSGQQPCLYGGEYFLKPPGQAGFPAHYDNQSLLVPAPYVPITVWIAMEESVSALNGGVYLVPESHKDSFPSEMLAEKSGNRPDIDYYGVILAPELQSRAICPKLKKGDVLIFAGGTVHFSSTNRSSSARRSLQLTYIPRGVPAHAGKYQKRVPIDFPLDFGFPEHQTL